MKVVFRATSRCSCFGERPGPHFCVTFQRLISEVRRRKTPPVNVGTEAKKDVTSLIPVEASRNARRSGEEFGPEAVMISMRLSGTIPPVATFKSAAKIPGLLPVAHQRLPSSVGASRP